AALGAPSPARHSPEAVLAARRPSGQQPAARAEQAVQPRLPGAPPTAAANRNAPSCRESTMAQRPAQRSPRPEQRRPARASRRGTSGTSRPGRRGPCARGCRDRARVLPAEPGRRLADPGRGGPGRAGGGSGRAGGAGRGRFGAGRRGGLSVLSSGEAPAARSTARPLAMDPALAVQLSEEVARKVLQYRRDGSGWKTCRESVSGARAGPAGLSARLRAPRAAPLGLANGVSVSWRPSVEFPGSLYRGEGVIDGPPEKVWECLRPAAGGLREQWDDNVSSFEVVQTISDTLCVSRTATPWAAMKVISPRDFVDLVLVKTYEDGTISSNATNVEHPSCPPRPGFVRGLNHPCGCLCEPVPGRPGQTHLVAFFQTELGGYLPRRAVDAFFPRSMAGFYANLRAAVRGLQG
ncbi:StAR-related lipid transfer protein 5, partial [Galemys pyrenaicus]